MLILNPAARWPLALLAGALMASPAAAKDHPIIIIGGSPLVIQQDCGWKAGLRTIVTRCPDNTVTSVEVKPPRGEPQVFRFSHEQCDIGLTFGDIRLAVQTDANGQNLRVTTIGDALFSAHFLKMSKGRFQSRRSDHRIIENLRILKAGAAEHVIPPSGHSEIVIHYE